MKRKLDKELKEEGFYLLQKFDTQKEAEDLRKTLVGQGFTVRVLPMGPEWGVYQRERYKVIKSGREKNG